MSNCIIAGEEKDPNRGTYNGVHNIANNTQKIENINDIVAGNLVTFNTGTIYGDYSHIGIITDVMRDDDGDVVDFLFIHASGSKGPIQTNYINSSYWNGKATGFYKWDTKPEVYIGPTLPQVTVLRSKPSVSNHIRALNVTPIFVNANPYIRK